MNTSNMTFTERIAAYTWRILKHSWEYNVRLGEETLTDRLVLNFMLFKPSYYKLFQCTKKEESQRGTDLKIRIHDVGTHAATLAVQAKKLSPPNEPHLRGHYRLDGKAESQLNILETYSRTVDAVPLYLLYNYVDGCDINRYWHCCRCLDKKQLGCTLVPSRNIRQAFKGPDRNNFDWIHKSCRALPWHCLFDCTQRRGQQGQTVARRSLSLLRELFGSSDDLPTVETTLSPLDDPSYDWVNFDPVEGAWPEWLWEQHGATLSAEGSQRLWGDLGEAVEIPRRLLLVKGERNESYKSGSAQTLSRERIEGRTLAASNRTDPYRSRLDSRLRGNDAL